MTSFANVTSSPSNQIGDALVTIVTPSPKGDKAGDNEIMEEVDMTKLKEDGGHERTEVLWGKIRTDDDIFDEASEEAEDKDDNVGDKKSDSRYPRQANRGMTY